MGNGKLIRIHKKNPAESPKYSASRSGLIWEVYKEYLKTTDFSLVSSFWDSDAYYP